MNPTSACRHCLLPIGRLGQLREIGGERFAFCCYGCCLAYQVHHGERDEPEAAALLIRIGIGGFLAMNIMLFSFLLYAETFGAADGASAAAIHWLLWILTTALLVVLGGPFFSGAWQAAIRGRLTTDSLVSIGTLAAYGYSAYQVWRGSNVVYFDTVTMVLILFTLGRYLEALGRVRAARSVAPMLAAERAQARIVTAGGETLQPVAAVKRDAMLRILPGERIPVDGVVMEGRSGCDEAILTGQPQMRTKVPGAVVVAGSINGLGQLLIRATSDGDSTRWVQISRLVREALARKSLLGNALDRMAAAFIPLVLLLAAGTLWFWSGRIPFEQALLASLAVLVVACPCSLGLAAPLATTLGIGLAARRGILLRSGGVLEKLARIKAIAFDKTGTLTEGRPQVVQILADGASERQVMDYAGALARTSLHPLAKAISTAAGSQFPADEASAQPGAGITGNVHGRSIALGSAAFMSAAGMTMPASFSGKQPLQRCTLVYVAWGGRVRGRIALADRLLPAAATLMSALRERDMPVSLLSGDRKAVVARTATRLGIPEWRAELMPEGKIGALQESTARYGPTAMVGDGLNDGPVLAAASVGIAVGGATDLARESADVVLSGRALEDLPWLIDLATQVRRSIRANLAWALGYNVMALALAASGLLQPVIAAGLMAGSSLLVVARSLSAARGSVSPVADRAPVARTSPA